MKTTIKKTSLTKLEKQFIIAYYESVADTLNYSTLIDVSKYMTELSLNQLKGVLGSLVNKGVFDPTGDIYEANFERYYVMLTTGLLSESELNDIAKEFGYKFDFDNLEYEYLVPLN